MKLRNRCSGVVFLLWGILILGMVRSANAQTAGDRILSLNECISIALQNNPDIGISAQGVMRNESGLLSAYGNLLPNVSVDYSIAHMFYGPSSVQYDAQGRPVQNDGFDYESFSFGVSSNLILFDGLTNYYNVRSARKNRQAAWEEFKYSKDMLSANVIRSYYNLVRNKMLLVVQEESMEQARQNLERSEALLKVGSATRADVLKAKVRYSNTRLTKIRTRNQMELARENLAALLNLKEEWGGGVDTSLTINFTDPGFQEEVDYALSNRPDLKSLDLYQQAAGAQISSARGGWFPVLGANFRYSWNDRQMADNLNFFKEEYSWYIAGFMSVNIFDRFVTSSRIKAARANQRIAEYNLEKSKLEAVKEVKTLVLGIREARERITVASETVEQAMEDLRLAEERYRVGAGTMLETIDAQVALTQAKADVIDAKCDYLVATADLSRATGRRIQY
ncbi:MAG: TolC family protein [Candidatus Krumholzibacteriota bacterium]|nr:TolC family protein [Candidatus Krumholzibacteriota bacterium]